MHERSAASIRSRRVTLALGFAALAAILAFMLIDLRGSIAFALELRAERLAALIAVAVAIAVSTVLFQTVTGNRILTPSIMGMDALYMLIQSVLVFTLGSIGFAALPVVGTFIGETAVMALLAAGLFLPILRHGGDLVLMLLVGVVLGVLFRSLASLVARLIDPNEFAVVQSVTHADFNTVDAALIGPCLIATVAGAALAWRWRHRLDVMALGADAAVGLGVDWRRTAVTLLIAMGVLVAASTALVGPVAFLGLVVVALAERLVGTSRHSVMLPAAAFTAILVLVGGQTILTHALDNTVTIGVVIELVGGAVFLALLLSRRWV